LPAPGDVENSENAADNEQVEQRTAPAVEETPEEHDTDTNTRQQGSTISLTLHDGSTITHEHLKDATPVQHPASLSSGNIAVSLYFGISAC